MKLAHELEPGDEVRVIRTSGTVDPGWEYQGLLNDPAGVPRLHLTKTWGGQVNAKCPRVATFNKWQEQIHFDLRHDPDRSKVDDEYDD